MALQLILYFTVLISFSACSEEEITLPQGKFLGIAMHSRNGTTFYGFKSIPYAKPPIGKLRFQPPQDVDHHNDVRNAQNYPPACVQTNFGQEDCLYLNVFTHRINSSKLLPVMVYIHGGAFKEGSSSDIHPEYIMDYPIVFVTLNYRLGILGYLSSGDTLLPGNNGMKDQVAALRWVKENVALFGGDPNNVLIFGQSAGGGSVHLHMYSPLSKGLFHKAISQSGVAISPWATIPSALAKDRMKAVSIITGCWSNETAYIIHCLRELPASDIVTAQTKLNVWHSAPTIEFSPVIEPDDTPDAFLKTVPAAGKELNSSIPWMTGVTSGEGAFIAIEYLVNNGSLAKEIQQNYKVLLPVLLFYDCKANRGRIPCLTESIKKYYFGDEDIGMGTYKQLVDIISHSYFTYPTTKAALFYKGRRYLYYYDRKNTYSLLDEWPKLDLDLGISHCEELWNLFGPGNRFNVTPESDETIHASHQNIKMWINFAHNDDPNDESVTRWDPVQSADLEYLHIKNSGMEMKKHFFKDKYDFWNNLQLFEEDFENYSNICPVNNII